MPNERAKPVRVDVLKAAIHAVQRGGLVECEREEWPVVRNLLQGEAARWLDDGDPIRAQIALQEVRRLDARFFGGADA